jgi:hypothetical protein
MAAPRRPGFASPAVDAVHASLAAVGLTRHVGKTRVICPSGLERIEVSPAVRHATRPPFGEGEVRLG